MTGDTASREGTVTPDCAVVNYGIAVITVNSAPATDFTINPIVTDSTVANRRAA